VAGALSEQEGGGSGIRDVRVLFVDCDGGAGDAVADGVRASDGEGAGAESAAAVDGNDQSGVGLESVPVDACGDSGVCGAARDYASLGSQKPDGVMDDDGSSALYIVATDRIRSVARKAGFLLARVEHDVERVGANVAGVCGGDRGERDGFEHDVWCGGGNGDFNGYRGVAWAVAFARTDGGVRLEGVVARSDSTDAGFRRAAVFIHGGYDVREVVLQPE